MLYRKVHVIVRLLLALMLTTSSLVLVSSTSNANGNFAQKTDQQAGCTYGTKPLSEWKMPELPESEGIHNAGRYGVSENDPCYVFFIWYSEMGPSFSYSAVLARENAYGDGLE
ncbi:MAG: hypothetical protein ACO23J_06090, partial [Candidatus Nanopelagicaceae bacterium]